jgi:ATP-binding protein involved in chromosome partitioning
MDNPIALRGGEASNALWEILTIVRWDGIENLYIDTPPGIGDEHLDILYRLRRRVKPIIVSTPSRLAMRAIDRLVDILREMNYREILFIENMGNGELYFYAKEKNLVYLGFIPYSDTFEMCIGSIENLKNCDMLRYIKDIMLKLLKL